MDKICPIMNRTNNKTWDNKFIICQEEKCMAWGTVKNALKGKDIISGKVSFIHKAVKGCKLIESKEKV